jgi:tetratricopeptide (TPR) repeat protein
MGWVQFQRKNYPDAEKFLLQAARLAPDDAEIHENLGDLYRETGRQSLALEQYERALALEEDRTAVRDKIDSLRLALGREGTAPAP